MTISRMVRVLIVDDNMLALESIQNVLERLTITSGTTGTEAKEYTVIARAMDGLQAVEMAQTLQPDLVLMDIEMPKLNGIEAARQIQQHQPTPVVMLTAYDTPDLIEQASDAGVMAYVLKPPNPGTIAAILPVALARFYDLQMLRQTNERLQASLATIKTLSGLIPICAWCGTQIQDEQGHWVKLEAYIEAHTEAEFTHGICPKCLEKLHTKK